MQKDTYGQKVEHDSDAALQTHQYMNQYKYI